MNPNVMAEQTVSVAVQLDAVSKVYGSGSGSVIALDNVTLSFRRGTFTAVMGPSGSGKSTLLQCAAGLLRPSSGQVLLDDKEISRLSEKESADVRRERIGFVFQSFNLLPALTAIENITLPFRLAKRTPDQEWLNSLLSVAGIAEHVGRHPHELSGGQQQRVAICRALAPRPQVVFADEPTGNLDTRSSREILELVRAIVDRLDQTVIMVTHDPGVAAYADAIVFLADGHVVDTAGQLAATDVAERLTRLADD
ncbi:putative ABC transport system ATP-binding protein [Nonomuraea solani]|uniref:Putative ABC transport system ATP-binding protein n=1 Tax=Nonomuraea solani TaxID=1144553 RepID=A0A1H6EZR2_9ACTN|nr:ABC transporter ATP-binding protein [Nonomuraea solani]SEH02359.1 putative ABC transport system ATP-binding protein [Nonomuraea solani]